MLNSRTEDWSQISAYNGEFDDDLTPEHTSPYFIHKRMAVMLLLAMDRPFSYWSRGHRTRPRPPWPAYTTQRA